jgi:hypothetical protein
MCSTRSRSIIYEPSSQRWTREALGRWAQAAARTIRLSQSLANLEAQLGVKLFDRAARYPRLTEEGRSLLANARSAADNVDEFKHAAFS